MNKLERVLAALEGRTPDRVPTFSQLFDSKPIDDALGSSARARVTASCSRRSCSRLVDSTTWLWNALAHPNVGGVGVLLERAPGGRRSSVSTPVSRCTTASASSTTARCTTWPAGAIAVRRRFRGHLRHVPEGMIGDPESWKAFKKVDTDPLRRAVRRLLLLPELAVGREDSPRGLSGRQPAPGHNRGHGVHQLRDVGAARPRFRPGHHRIQDRARGRGGARGRPVGVSRSSGSGTTSPTGPGRCSRP